MHECALFRWLPQLAERIPWLSLAHLPTPVEPLELDGLPAARQIWIKRDDLTAEPYGGNKVRKLEFLLAAAKARGARRLITVGAAGSHHALATTIYGRSLGFDVSLVLFPQPLTDHVREVLLLDQAYGAELRYTHRMETVPAALFVATLRYRNQGAFVIPPGGSDATGTLGYVSAALELAEQIQRGELPEPRTVIVAAGTLGTAAGMALGFQIAGIRAHIKAVRITSRIVTNERVLARLVRGAQLILRRAGARIDVADAALAQVQLVHDQIGRGYGQETPAGSSASRLFEESGVRLDAAYTAKAAAALIQDAPATDPPILFWHTLSAPNVLPKAPAETAALPRPFRDYLAAAV